MKPTDFEAIFWDFDGVLLNSNSIRNDGFIEVLKEYPQEEVDKLLTFHKKNGGLSRYIKFRYFFEVIREEKITDKEIQEWAIKFSAIMKDELTSDDLKIDETLNFVNRWHQDVPMYIVSGSDQEELRYLCQKHGIDKFFKRIHGSPKEKKEWISTILHEENLNAVKCIMIGDSWNDYEAAFFNEVAFVPYNMDRDYRLRLNKSSCIAFKSLQIT